MHRSAHPLHRQLRHPIWRHPAAYRLLVASLLGVLLLTLLSGSASARPSTPRDRRGTREIAIPYERVPASPRPRSGYVTRREQPLSRIQSEPANSGESRYSTSKKNDENPPVPGTRPRLAR